MAGRVPETITTMDIGPGGEVVESTHPFLPMQDPEVRAAVRRAEAAFAALPPEVQAAVREAEAEAERRLFFGGR